MIPNSKILQTPLSSTCLQPRHTRTLEALKLTISIATSTAKTKTNTMMQSLSWSTFFLIFSGVLAASQAAPFARSGAVTVSPRGALFGVVPRGGGLFGGKDDVKEEVVAADGEKKMYPAMTQEEVEGWLEHIPVFAVTDQNGAGVVLKPENDTSVFYFFLNPMQANATLQQLQSSNEEMDLKVSAFSLGKIWFNLLNSDSENEVLLKAPGSEDSDGETTKGVQYRVVPDTRDLLGARMLLTMSPEDGENLKEGGSMTPEMAQEAIKKAMTESPKFNATYNEIPVFTIAQMRMQKQLGEGESGEPITLLPMYFSLQNMVGTWQEFMKEAPADVQGTEPAINLMSLHDLVEMMQKESEIDWRHVVLVPSAPSANGEGSGAAVSAQSADPMAQMGGATLGDLE